MAGGLERIVGASAKLSHFVEQYQNYNESDKEWRGRKQFILKHIHNYPGPKLDQLLALSMVFTNHVFMGCRYNARLMEKVLEMAEDIDVGERPSFELVPGAKAQKRPCSPNAGQEPPKKKNASKFQPRPRFQPVHFVASSTTENENVGGEKNRSVLDNFVPQKETENCFSIPKEEDDYSDPDDNTETEGPSYAPYQDSDLFIYDCSFPGKDDFQTKGKTSSFMSKLKQDYTAKFEAHQSAHLKGQKDNSVKQVADSSKQGHRGLGFQDGKRANVSMIQSTTHTTGNDLKPCQSSAAALLSSPTFSQAEIAKKQSFIDRLVAVVSKKLADPGIGGPNNKPNYTSLLASSVQACRTNPEHIYVHLKEIPPADLPKKKLPVDGYACELRCSGMYLTTGYSGSKIGARDRATEQAVKLLQKPVDVKVARRKSKHTYVDDLVVCDKGALLHEFPPVLKPVDKIVSTKSNNGPPSGQQETNSRDPSGKKPWDNFILHENATDPIGVLNNSAAYNKMTTEYKYELLPNLKWCCRLYLQGHLLAEGYGSKKYSKHAAAVEGIKILREVQPPEAARQSKNETRFTQTVGIAGKKPMKRIDLKDIVLYENASNAVCTLNDTAQFNKISVDYRFNIVSNQKWKCDVYLADQFVASAVGIKKNVKHSAAEIAVNTLKQTQPVVKANLNKGGSRDAISRNQILGRSAEEAYRQQIKEDNIGNQLLRKMGWTGGGLGKEGEGIAEPIAVKEQFTREGLGLTSDKGPGKINRRDIEGIIRNYAASDRQDDLTFSKELTLEERKQIHQIAQKYGLKSKSHGQGTNRFLIVRRKRNREELIDQLKQEGQVGCYELVMPQNLW